MHIVRGFAFRQRLYCSAMKARCASGGEHIVFDQEWFFIQARLAGPKQHSRRCLPKKSALPIILCSFFSPRIFEMIHKKKKNPSLIYKIINHYENKTGCEQS
jgi:hypothetical protein